MNPQRGLALGDRSAPNLKRYLPWVVAATLAVSVVPIALVSQLTSAGLVRSVFVSAALAILISLVASSAGTAWWKKRRAEHDLVFSELMIWGWLRRLRTERRLSRAAELLGNEKAVSASRQVELFEELVSALEARDAYTHGHTRRVTRHAAAIAERMGLPREQVTKVRTAAAIHDVGKLNTPREVLNKPGRLTDEEFTVIKQHPVDGAKMAVRLGDDEITAMVLHHHERLDGTGYPSRLAGDAIPLGARIIAVADTFDAITSSRAYRGASSHKKALGILTKEAGTQLDPDAVRAFCSHYSGKRGVAVWSLLTGVPERLIPWPALSSAPLTKTVAALAVAGALGGSAAELAKSSHYSGIRRAAGSAGTVRAFAQVAGAASGSKSSGSGPRPVVSSRPRRPGSSTAAPGRARSGHGGSLGQTGVHGTSAPATGTGPAGSTAQSGSSGGASRPVDTRPSSQTGSGGGSGGGGSTPSGSSPGGSSQGGGSSSQGGTPSLPNGTPPLPSGTPSLPSGTPSLPTTTPSLPTTTPSLPTGTPTVPVGTPTTPGGTPSLPTP
jgi:putative nucleotidyltransferase with HDIG domain